MESSDWAKLPKYLLDSVVERLPSVPDYVRFSEVCMSWKSVADDNRSKRTAPTLLSYTGEEEIWNLCDVADDKVLDFQFALPNKRFCGSRGWLITMDENFRVTLVNPLSKVNVSLPALKIPEVRGRPKVNSIIIPALKISKTRRKMKTIIIPVLNFRKIREKRRRTHWAKQCDLYVYKATISADPISNANNCIVMVIYGPYCQLAFIRLGKDTKWTYFDSEHLNFEEVLYVGDKFYAVNAVDEKSQLFSIDVTAQFDEEEDVLLVAEEAFEQDKRFFIKRYLVELTENELLMVKRYIIYCPGTTMRVTMKFELFKLDHDNCEWTKINTLGDVSLFLGDSSSISVLASSSFGYLPNHIYYLHDWDRQIIVSGNPAVRDFGVCNIEREKRMRSSFDTGPAAALMRMTDQTPIWTVL